MGLVGVKIINKMSALPSQIRILFPGLFESLINPLNFPSSEIYHILLCNCLYSYAFMSSVIEKTLTVILVWDWTRAEANTCSIFHSLGRHHQIWGCLFIFILVRMYESVSFQNDNHFRIQDESLHNFSFS